MPPDSFVKSLTPEEREYIPPPPKHLQPYAKVLKEALERGEFPGDPKQDARPRPGNNSEASESSHHPGTASSSAAERSSSTDEKSPAKDKPKIKTKQEQDFDANMYSFIHYSLLMRDVLKPVSVGPYEDTMGAHQMDYYFTQYGCPQDPMAKMYIQHMVLLHHFVPVLYQRAMLSQSPEVADILFKQADKMQERCHKTMNELRNLLAASRQKQFAPGKPTTQVGPAPSSPPCTADTQPVDDKTVRHAA